MYPSAIIRTVKQCMNDGLNDKSKDEIIAQMSKREVLTYCLEYEGIFGYTGKILGYVNGIYDTDLE